MTGEAQKSFGRFATPIAVAACAIPGLILGFALGHRTAEGLFAYSFCGGFIGLGLLPLFRAAAERPAGRIIFLRRFGLERPPAFPMSRIVEKLASYGFEVITLSDQIVRSDRETFRPMNRVISSIIAGILSLFFVIFFAIITMIGMLQITFIIGNERIFVFLLFTTIGFLIIFYAEFSEKSIFLHICSWVSALLSATATQAFPLKHDMTALSEPQLDDTLGAQLRHSWQAGMVVVTASSDNWEAIVEYLVKTASYVLIDISKPSDSLLKEVSVLANHFPADRIIWLHDETCPLFPRSVAGSGYQIFGRLFKGPFKSFRYPSTAPTWADDPFGGADETLAAYTNQLRNIMN